MFQRLANWESGIHEQFLPMYHLLGDLQDAPSIFSDFSVP
jgi:hypothetical protein